MDEQAGSGNHDTHRDTLPERRPPTGPFGGLHVSARGRSEPAAVAQPDLARDDRAGRP